MLPINYFKLKLTFETTSIWSDPNLHFFAVEVKIKCRKLILSIINQYLPALYCY